MTILGPLPCIRCKAPVTIVRRTVEVGCHDCGLPGCETYHGPRTNEDHGMHTHTLRDIGPLTPVDADGARHECAVGAA